MSGTVASNMNQERDTEEQVLIESYVWYNSRYRFFLCDYTVSRSKAARSAAATPVFTTNLKLPLFNVGMFAPLTNAILQLRFMKTC